MPLVSTLDTSGILLGIGSSRGLFVEKTDVISNDLPLIVLRVLYPAIDKNCHAFRMLVGFDTLSESPYREL